MAAPTQDLPPAGGYAPINYKRIPARTYLKGWHFFAGFLAIKCSALYIFAQNFKVRRQGEIENRSARMAILPLLRAEQDRGLLKQLRLNREEEARLMANVPDWKVGCLYQEPIFKTVPNTLWVEPTPRDFFMHSDNDAYNDRIHFNHYH